jgi:hypothetical protein
LSQRRKNRFQHHLRLLKHLVVPESQHAESRAREVSRSLEIFEQPFRVVPAVKFDHQSRAKAHEIHDVVAHRHLSTESIAAQLPIAYEAPKAAFGVAGMRAQCACG